MIKIIQTVVILVLIISVCIMPNTTLLSAKGAIKLCLETVIPSLFPVMFLINMLISGNRLDYNNKYLKLLIIFLLSITGGYPIGSKIADKLYQDKQTDEKGAQTIQNLCTHAGPGFIILAIGAGKFLSVKLGFIMFLAHIIPSFVLLTGFSPRIKLYNKQQNEIAKPFSERLNTSAKDTSNAIISICGLILVFSVISGIVSQISANSHYIKTFTCFLEISNGINNTNNVYFISFILSFGGFCVHSQINCVFKNAEMNYKSFLFARIIHGAASSLLTYIIVKIFNIKIVTSIVKTNAVIIKSYTRVLLIISMFFMLLVLFADIADKKRWKKYAT